MFSDKTGTLTSNIMNFKMMSVNGKTYGRVDTHPDNQVKMAGISNVDFEDEQFMAGCGKEEFLDFFKVMSLCHEATIDTHEKGAKYSSSSPDEIAFVNFAKLCGYEYRGESNQNMRLENNHTNTIENFRQMAVLEFSSDRKRMSVIVKEPNGAISLYMKGADSLITPLLKKNDPLLEATSQHVEQFSTEGLRTLMLAKRTLTVLQF